MRQMNLTDVHRESQMKKNQANLRKGFTCNYIVGCFTAIRMGMKLSSNAYQRCRSMPF